MNTSEEFDRLCERILDQVVIIKELDDATNAAGLKVELVAWDTAPDGISDCNKRVVATLGKRDALLELRKKISREANSMYELSRQLVEVAKENM